jgi:hypothetical protein
VGSVVNLLIHPVGALLIGSAAGALSVLGYRYLSVNFLAFFNYFSLFFLLFQSDAINFTAFFTYSTRRPLPDFLIYLWF